MRARIVSAFLSACVSIGVFAQQPEPAKPAASEPKPAAPIPPVPEAPAPPQVTLLEPGEEPRQVLRIKPAADLAQTCRLRLLMNLTMKMGDQDYPSPPMPAILITMTMKVTSISPEGDISYALTISDCRIEANPESPAGMAEMMNEALAPMSKLTATCTVTSRGINKEIKFKLPEDLPGDAAAAMAGLSDQMSQVSSPLPEEAVGKGARWEVKAKIKSQGMTVDQTTTCTLTDFRDNTVFMDVALQQTAATQAVTGPAIPEGTTMELETLKSSGTGKTEYPLTMIAPTNSVMKLATDLAMSIKQGDQVSKMKQDIKLDMTWSPAEAPKPPAAPAPAEPAK